MKYIIITILFFSACCNSKTVKQGESAKQEDTVTNTKNDSAINTNAGNDTLPKCISDMIARYKKAPVRNPPVKIYSYRYKGKTVFYVNAECCDMFSDVYDSNCKLLGHPDGGFTGRGDGSLPNFKTEAGNEKLIWSDTRK